MGAPSLATSQGCGLKYLVLFCAGLFNARARLRTGFARREIPISRRLSISWQMDNRGAPHSTEPKNNRIREIRLMTEFLNANTRFQTCALRNIGS